MSQIIEKISANVKVQSALRRGISPAIVSAAIDTEIESQTYGVELADELELRRIAENRFFGFGKLQPLLDDSSIEEIWINGSGNTFVARGGVSESLDVSFQSGELSGLVERMLRHTGRRLDRSSPFVDAALPDGSRLHVAIPDVTRLDFAINIRKFPQRAHSMADLVSRGSLSEAKAKFLTERVRAGANVLVSGATQAGKTTLLCALLEGLRDDERLISVEEIFEIKTSLKDWVAMQTRQPNLEGHGEVTLRRLIKEALRMRPSRLVVGEVRGAEALDLLIALNSGIPGICTIHANSASDALRKLGTLTLLAGQNITSDFTEPTIASCIDLVVHCELDSSGRRKVAEIRQMLPFSGSLQSELVEC